MTRANQKKLLAGCLVGLVCAAGYAAWQSPRQQRVSDSVETPRAVAAPRRAAPAEAARPAAPESVRLDLLEEGETTFPGSVRDLFGPLFAAPTVPVAPPAPPLPPPPPTPVAMPEPGPTVEPVATLPSTPFSVLGFVETEGRKTVFLEAGGEVFLARQGETFGSDFEVTELTPQRLVIAQQGKPHPIILPLQERPAVSSFGSPPAPAASPGAARRILPPPRPAGR
ncbi:hypothetical protein [Geoalkalibacter sp.]|uniref:hypothetical protein n=1 Tax=Geoalkalibacter sp. TaxID=3041440 RepID=UPI00272E3D92|nr:hypothetical protein [Geoalkalibacter sp.]